MSQPFNILSRREFVSRNARLAALAAMSTLTDIPLVVKRALADGTIGLPGSSGRVKKVLFVFLRGGNDALNALVPINDPSYGTSRPTIGIQKNVQDSLWDYNARGPALWAPSGKTGPTYGGFGIPAGNGFAALHPALKFMVPVYNAGHMAMIHRVGYPKQSRSHFDSQNYWETGTPSINTTKEGIFYKAMFESGLPKTSALTGVSIQSSLPLILRGSGAAMTNLTTPDRYDLLGIPNSAAGNVKAYNYLKDANLEAFPDKLNRDFLSLQYDNMTKTLAVFQDLITGDFKKNFLDNEDTDGDRPYSLFPTSDELNGGWRRAPGATDPQRFVVPAGTYSFFRNLQAAAVLLNKTEAVVAGTQMDGFDTHNNQGGATGSHANLLKQIGWSMYALQKYFTAYGDRCRWEDIVVVTLSEFGRTSIENDNNGTDHAEANVMWVSGGAVKGFKPSAQGGVERSGIFQCGPSDPIPWNVGPGGTLFGVEKRYLKRAVDYRSVLGRIIRDHLGSTQEQLNRIIPGYAVPGESLRTAGTQSADGTPVVGEPDFI